MTIYVLRPMAMALGIKGGKIMRFTERMSCEVQYTSLIYAAEGYAVFYFGIFGPLGIVRIL